MRRAGVSLDCSLRQTPALRTIGEVLHPASSTGGGERRMGCQRPSRHWTQIPDHAGPKRPNGPESTSRIAICLYQDACAGPEWAWTVHSDFGSAHNRRSSPSSFVDRWRQEEGGSSAPWEIKGASAPPPQPDSNSRPRRAETPSPHHRAASRSRAADPVRAQARPRRTPSDSPRRAVSRSGAVDPLRAPRPHTLKAQTANDRPPSAVRTRKSRADAPQGRRGHRIGESARRPQGHGAERRGLPPRLRAAARGGSSARISRHGSPPPHPAGSDVRSRPPKRAEHDSRLPSPAPPIRFTAD